MIREILIDSLFLIAIVIVYFYYSSIILGPILLNLCNCSYSVRLEVPSVNGWQYVGMVFRYLAYMRVHPNVPGRLVVRIGDSYVGFSVVHPLYVGLAEHGREVCCYYVSHLP